MSNTIVTINYEFIHTIYNLVNISNIDVNNLTKDIHNAVVKVIRDDISKKQSIVREVSVQDSSVPELVELPVQPPVQLPVQLPVQPQVQLPVQPPVQLPVQPPVQLPVQPPVQPQEQQLVQELVQLPVQPPVQPQEQQLVQELVQLPVQPQEQLPVQLSDQLSGSKRWFTKVATETEQNYKIQRQFNPFCTIGYIPIEYINSNINIISIFDKF